MSTLTDAGINPNDVHFSSNHPDQYGWEYGNPSLINTGFRWKNPVNGQTYQFPGGVRKGTENIWTVLFNRLAIEGNKRGFVFHPNTNPNVGGFWGYEARDNVNSPGTKSYHGFGLACDINAPWNPNDTGWQSGPYGFGSWADAICRDMGFLDGGEWGDAMHKELHLDPGQAAKMNAYCAKLLGQPSNAPTPPPPAQHPSAPGHVHPAYPFPNSEVFGDIHNPSLHVHGGNTQFDNATVVNNIKLIQRAVGVAADGVFGPATTAAVKAFQKRSNLSQDGLVGPNTWAKLPL